MSHMIEVVLDKVVNLIRVEAEWWVEGATLIVIVTPRVGGEDRITLETGLVVEELPKKVLEHALVPEGEPVQVCLHQGNDEV